MRTLWRILNLACLAGCLWGMSVAAATLTTGQSIDFALGVPGLNNSGGGLLFNHPGGLASDGTALVMADRMNNRVLIWKQAPTSNTAPDLVLGQPDMLQSLAGSAANQMNFPGQVSIGGGKLVVADSGNDRVLVWNSLPTRNGQAADLVFTLTSSNGNGPRIEWPWGVWTDGTRLIVASTSIGMVNVWNTFPTAANTPPSYTLNARNPITGSADFGTPRNIATDGSSYLIIGDHNAKNVTGSGIGAFVWNSFPTADSAYSYYGIYDKCTGNCGQFPGNAAPTSDGRLLLMASPYIHVYSGVPTSSSQLANPALQLGGGTLGNVGFNGMDGSALALLPDGRLYGASYNGNAILGWKTVPTSATKPDFVIGAPDSNTNTLVRDGFMQNPIPVSDGKRLVVGSGYDGKVYVWNSLPTANGQRFDYTINLISRKLYSEDNDLYNGQFVTVGGQSVAVWKSLPGSDAAPDLEFSGGIGSVKFVALKGVALDAKYLYLADSGAGKVYVFDALPNAGSEPRFILEVTAAGRLTSDGNYLAVPSDTPGGTVTVFDLGKLGSSSAKLGEIKGSNATAAAGGLKLWPTHAYLNSGKLYVSDAQNNFVYVWNSLSSALADTKPDVLLGQAGKHGATSDTGFMMPIQLLVTQDHLWVADFKFSTRLNALRLDGCARPYLNAAGALIIPDLAVAGGHYRASLQYDSAQNSLRLGSVAVAAGRCDSAASYSAGVATLTGLEVAGSRYNATLTGDGPFSLTTLTPQP